MFRKKNQRSVRLSHNSLIQTCWKGWSEFQSCLKRFSDSTHCPTEQISNALPIQTSWTKEKWIAVMTERLKPWSDVQQKTLANTEPANRTGVNLWHDWTIHWVKEMTHWMTHQMTHQNSIVNERFATQDWREAWISVSTERSSDSNDASLN